MSQQELVSVRAQRLHSDGMERRRRGECKLGRERERELRQRHVGDVVWLPQAEGGGGVGERWRSAECEQERGRQKLMVRRRGVKLGFRRKIDALVLESRIDKSEKTQEESKLKTTLNVLFGISAVLRRGR